MGTVRASVAAQSAALAQAADEILAEPKVEPRRFVPLSSAEAVLRYWSDFIPSWAGAISIDLLPVVLVLVLMIVHDAMRRENGIARGSRDDDRRRDAARHGALPRRCAGEPLPDAARHRGRPSAAAGGAPMPEPAAEARADATVTPLDVARKRGDGPARA